MRQDHTPILGEIKQDELMTMQSLLLVGEQLLLQEDHREVLMMTAGLVYSFDA